MIGKTIKSAFDVPVVVKAAYAFKYFDLALTYKQGTCNVMKGVPYMKSGRTRDLQVSILSRYSGDTSSEPGNSYYLCQSK